MFHSQPPSEQLPTWQPPEQTPPDDSPELLGLVILLMTIFPRCRIVWTTREVNGKGKVWPGEWHFACFAPDLKRIIDRQHRFSPFYDMHVEFG